MPYTDRRPHTPIYKLLWWQLYHAITWVWFKLCYRFRCSGVEHVPRTGPVLLISNHQSFLDPIVVNLGVPHRQCVPLARKTLWNSAFYRALTLPFDPIPVDQENPGDLKAMKASIETLKKGHAMMLFPEGSRTHDGAVGSFEAGMMLLVKRARPTVVPVALEGAYAIWPNSRRRPRPFGKIACRYGEPVPAEALLEMSSEDARELLRGKVEAMRAELHDTLGLPGEAKP
ncbi:MAG: lysophospholipid acyltransferase family protein [Planctomycetota bacterium]